MGVISPSSSSSSSSSVTPSSPAIQTSGGISSISKVSPSVLLIIIILAIIFFVSGLLHLLVRYLLRPSRRDPDEILDSVTALQGQLQQLFHLHDSGVDQSFIDTLPVFNYKAIIGLKSPFDCAVCLSEFEADDKLRLLPKCSHAFHMECIDTWLLSHSTCPLCRANLIPDFSSSNRHCSPLVLVLESGSDSSREIMPDLVSSTANNPVAQVDSSRKSCEIQVKDDAGKVMPVKLGKYRNVDLHHHHHHHNGGESSSANKNVDSRRCFSMGSFAYVMDESSSLQVPIRTPVKKAPGGKKPTMMPLNPGHRLAMSECGGGDESRREFVGFEAFRNAEILENNSQNKAIGNVSKKESFSFSKIWLRGRREEMPASSSSRRAVSFRFPVHTNLNSVAKGSSKNGGGRRTISEIEFGRWENDFDSQSICSLDSQANHPSFARKTLLWLMGRQQNKVVHDSQFSSQLV